MSDPDKANGDENNEQKLKSPAPQRKLKLNRRGFHLVNSPLCSLLSDKPVQHSSVNGCDDGVERERARKDKTDVPQKRIISLSSIKSSSGSTSEKISPVKEKDSSSIMREKKIPITFSQNSDKKAITSSSEGSSSSDPPPKKKHKPITWP